MKSRVVHVQLTNRKALLGCASLEVFDEINEILKFRLPQWKYSFLGRKYMEAMANKTPEQREEIEDEFELWDGYNKPLQHGRMGSGLFLAMKEKLAKELNLNFKIQEMRKYPDFQHVNGTKKATDFETRKYQVDCLSAMFEWSSIGGLILNATGTGKTFIAGRYFQSLKGAALFVVDELQLLKQAKKEIEEVTGEKVGEIGNSVFDIQRITVGTIQTIHRHRYDDEYVKWTKTLQCIIIDEVHLALNRRNFETIRAIQPPVCFGLTATLELKKKHVAMRAYDLCGPVLFSYPLKQGEQEGVLSKGIVVAVKVENQRVNEKIKGKLSWWRRRALELKKYPIDYQELIVEGRERNQFIRSLLKEAYKSGKYTVALVERVQHIEDLSAKLTVPHHLVYGEKRVEERLDSTEMFERGDVRTIIANKVFHKGINIKRLDLIVDAAAMKSKNNAIQKYGRGVRLCDGKKGLIYIDIADVGNRFEKAAKSRRTALKRIGVKVFLVESSIGVKQILDMAEKKLAEENHAGSLETDAQRVLPGFESGKNEESGTAKGRKETVRQVS